jgi:hypothetical protein
MVINKGEVYKFYSQVPVTDRHNGKTVIVMDVGNMFHRVQDENGVTFAAFSSELKRVKEAGDDQW